MSSDLGERARGRWRGILIGLGVHPSFLNSRHGPCVLCGGHDRWRFDNKDGLGTFICSRCGSGDGVILVQKLKGVDFKGAKELIEREIGTSPIDSPKPRRNESWAKEMMTSLWGQGRALGGQDIASRYLQGRGIKTIPGPSALRWVPDLVYDLKGKKTRHPGILAKFVAPDDKSAILHRTYLREPGLKADLPEPRKMMPGFVPPGGAIRLGPAGEEMGVAEGIENALKASQCFGLTVWACASAIALTKWVPPPGCKRVTIFGDLDPGFAGQMASYSLAYRLKAMWANPEKTEHYSVDVRYTRWYDDGQISEDWADLND